MCSAHFRPVFLTREDIRAVLTIQSSSSSRALRSREVVNTLAIASKALVLAVPEMNGQFTLQQYCLRLLANPRSQLQKWCTHSTLVFLGDHKNFHSVFFSFLMEAERLRVVSVSVPPTFQCELQQSRELGRAWEVLFSSETALSFCSPTSTHLLRSSLFFFFPCSVVLFILFTTGFPFLVSCPLGASWESQHLGICVWGFGHAVSPGYSPSLEQLSRRYVARSPPQGWGPNSSGVGGLKLGTSNHI